LSASSKTDFAARPMARVTAPSTVALTIPDPRNDPDDIYNASGAGLRDEPKTDCPIDIVK
jgi:hypothetical protein